MKKMIYYIPVIISVIVSVSIIYFAGFNKNYTTLFNNILLNVDLLILCYIWETKNSKR